MCDFHRTGGTDDNLTDLKKLLIIVDEMQRTKPNENQSIVYSKKNKNEGDNIRAAALNDMSDSDDDDFIDHGDHGSSVHEMSSARSASTSFFNSGHLTLQEEELMDQELMREYDESLQNQPSTSRAYEIPSPNESLALQEVWF